MFDMKSLKGNPRLLLDVSLLPVQGNRFQPTGFPDLGAATYTLPGRGDEPSKEMLLVESAQSMANRLEATTWDQVANDLVPPLRGLPYISVSSPKGRFLTSSVLEAHRLNSPYFLDSSERFLDKLKAALEAEQGEEPEAVDLRQAANVVFRYDPNSILHGLFLSSSKLAGGRYRFVRLLSAFIEAEGVSPVESGGVKNDRVNPSGDTKTGYGNVPFHRTEFVASSITAHFAVDLATLKGYGLGDAQEDLLIGLALWKIRALLDGTLRLRTACDLVPESLSDIRFATPEGFVLPSAEELSAEMPKLISACRDYFADPPVTRLTWSAKEAKVLAAERTKKDRKGSEAGGEEKE